MQQNSLSWKLLVFLLLFLPAGPVIAESYGSHLINPCGLLNAPLTGGFATEPCDLTRDNRSLDYAQDYYGGEQFAKYLEEWWKKEFLPALKAMTKQLNASRIDQTRQFGAMIDGQVVGQVAATQQGRELESHNNDGPNELSCLSGSNQAALSQSSRSTTALTNGFRQDIGRRSANAAGTTAEGGPAAEQRTRWEEYCAEFHDPESNNGVSACANPATPGQIVNGDIDIENLLLKDTIDMANPHQYKAALTLLQNLVQPKVKQKIPDAVVNTSAGREWILKQQHLESVRNVATDVVASIISRRTAITGTSAGITINPIRTKAGIDPAKISTDPSYNEIMLAMTKERFYDPGYFVKVHDETGAVQQEQLSISTFVALQYQDIYKLQEQINALMAARAALKSNANPRSSQTGSNPLR